VTVTKADRYRKPDAAPTAAQVADAERWAKLADSSLATTQAAAEKWRTGLAAFVTIITGGLLIKGPEAAADVERAWLVVLTVLAATGLGGAILGLWAALSAAAGSPAEQNLSAVVRQYGGVKQFEIAAARSASRRLRVARRLVAASLVLLAATVVVWWWVPTRPESPPALVKIEHDGVATCGELKSGDGGNIVVQVDGEHDPTTIPLTKVTNIRVVASC
jgi:hypothetical protein